MTVERMPDHRMPARGGMGAGRPAVVTVGCDGRPRGWRGRHSTFGNVPKGNRSYLATRDYIVEVAAA